MYRALIFGLAFWVGWTSQAFSCPSEVEDGADWIEFRQGDVWPEILYQNHSTENSGFGEHRLCLDGVAVFVDIQSGTKGREKIIVVPEDNGVYAEPPEAEVYDGDFAVIQIILPIF